MREGRRGERPGCLGAVVRKCAALGVAAEGAVNGAPLEEERIRIGDRPCELIDLIAWLCVALEGDCSSLCGCNC